ncbi:DNA-binding response regulator [Cronobacter malonaticus]|uniref:DNA-binding response regulator n=3 Tax=Cronobacter malonaticus TaxID=413503 RepID=A0ABX5K8Y1_9ENTR|nr:helix-turn-helix transcriptional regulator [Cronobacter malonaticus LMG 23826]EGT4279220.1 DNA-binding response regulator [Cronobacter malonaticus]EGT4289283.1 DNA-binding response regulator [Cronobacter malonaticus]EGT4296869.1 DNA-binding response regulator [Cronobacter malonaticus]EGT4314677.1 DNA-binding response regulator [Cronobacter malonaticus]
MRRHFPETELYHYNNSAEISLPLLNPIDMVLAELPCTPEDARRECEGYYSLVAQAPGIHWIFLVPAASFSLAVQMLMRPETTLLSTAEPVEGVVNAVRLGREKAERVSQMLVTPRQTQEKGPAAAVMLTTSEKQVLRLLGKGWGINQIAQMLKKSNKTISAQKNSAMRRLSLRGNAEMYAWISSLQGLKELNLLSLHKEQAEWNTESKNETLR